MSAPIEWKAIELCSTIFNPILHPHVLTHDPETEQISVEMRYSKRKRFHMSTCMLITILVFEFHFLARHIFESNFEHKNLTPLYIELALITLLHLVLTFINQTAGQQLWGSVNAALKLERKISGQAMAPLGYSTQIGHWTLICQEIRKIFRRDPTSDMLGVLIYGLSVFLSFIGVAWTPFGVYYNFDPGFFFFDYIFHPMSNQTLTTKVFCYAARLIIAYWSVSEASRSYALTLIFYAVYWNINLKCLRSLRRLQGFSKDYIQLKIVIQIGQQPFRNMVGVLMICGFVISVVGNYISLLGWKFIPFEVNISICLITLVVYLIISTCVPTVINLNEESKRMLNMWPSMCMQKRYVLANCTLLRTGELRKLWRKTCQAQKPITIYWCTSKFQKDSKSNYYSKIVEYTVNLMLGYEATHLN